MHRFGRSAQQKLKDRWGGSFILATVLALVGAWFAGSWLNDTLKDNDTAGSGTVTPGGTQIGKLGTGTPSNTVSLPAPSTFNLYLVQVGAFRSEASAQRLAQKLTERDFTAMVAPRNTAGFYKVYAGLHTSGATAQETKSRVLAEAADLVTEAWTITVAVNHDPEAIPVMADTSKSAEVKKGMESMNSYLYEAAMWMDKQSGDLIAIAKDGQTLTKLATDLSKATATNPTVTPLASLATAAGANATEIQTAAKKPAGAVEHQKAMTGYLTVLDMYRSLQTVAAGN